jgi:MoaA/NifB/PqqE/SkfB family radical SAM enzyme
VTGLTTEAPFDAAPVRLPGSGPGRQPRPRLFTFNVVVTGRCNAACTYCHYYLQHDRKAVAYDIADEQFDVYMDFIAYWLEQVPGYTRFRFSGGDPMVLGERLFALAERGYARTGVAPFILTAGKALNERWVTKARESRISHVFVSVENPLAPDPGAPNPIKVVTAIGELDSPDLPIVPGVCVVPNELFGQLYEICAWFYERIGRIPVIHEINYDAYRRPTEDQWRALERNVARVYREFYRVTPLNLFPSVSPELGYGAFDPYIFELDLENTYEMTADNYRAKLGDVTGRLIDSNYPVLRCPQTGCDWWEFCDNTKWYWQGDRFNSKQAKLSDYCRFKRLLNDAFYREIIDQEHEANEDGIDADRYYKVAVRQVSPRQPR